MIHFSLFEYINWQFCNIKSQFVPEDWVINVEQQHSALILELFGLDRERIHHSLLLHQLGFHRVPLLLLLHQTCFQIVNHCSQATYIFLLVSDGSTFLAVGLSQLRDISIELWVLSFHFVDVIVELSWFLAPLSIGLISIWIFICV